MVSVVPWSRPRRTEVRDGRRETGGRRPGSRGRDGADGGARPAAGRDLGRVGRAPFPCRRPRLHAAQGDPPGGRPHDRPPRSARGPRRGRRAPARPLARLIHDDARGPGAVHAGGPGRGEESARAARPVVASPARGDLTEGARPGGWRRLHATRDGVLRGGLGVLRECRWRTQKRSTQFVIAEHEDRADRAHPGSSLKTGYIALLYETSSSSPRSEEHTSELQSLTN